MDFETPAPCGVAASLVVAGMILAASPQAASAQSFSAPPFTAKCASLARSCKLELDRASVQEQVSTQTLQDVTDSVRDRVRSSIADSIHSSIRTITPITPITPPPIDPGDSFIQPSSLKPGGDPSTPGRGRNSSPDPSQLSGPSLGDYGPAAKQWFYGANLFNSADRGIALDTRVSVATVAGAADVTRVGVFSATDALTFIATGLNSWVSTKTTGLPDTNTATPSASATIAYLNGSFSTDLSVLASWIPASPDSDQGTRALAYTANFQYHYQAPYSVWFEPTAGVTYGEQFNGNFADRTATSTEIHGGLRFGGETRWMGYIVQPTLSAVAFKVIEQNGAAIQTYNPALNDMVNPAGAVGIRGSAKMTVLWKANFSTYLDLHASTTSSPDMPNVQVLGVQGGMRYSF